MVGGFNPSEKYESQFYHFMDERSQSAVARARVPCASHTFIHWPHFEAKTYPVLGFQGRLKFRLERPPW